MIDVRSVTVRRGGRLLADGFNWQLPDPGLYLVAGGNGCGKSLLCDLIAGRLKPNAGSIAIDGEPLYRLLGGYAQHIFLAHAELAQSDGEPFADYMEAELAQSQGNAANLPPVLKTLEQLFDAPATTPLGRLSHGQVLLAQIALAVLAPARVALLDGHLTYLDGEYCTAAAGLLDKADLEERFFILTAARLARPFTACRAIYMLGRGLPLSIRPLPQGAAVDTAPRVLESAGALRVYFDRPLLQGIASGRTFTLVSLLEDGVRVRLSGTLAEALEELARIGAAVRAIEWEPSVTKG